MEGGGAERATIYIYIYTYIYIFICFDGHGESNNILDRTRSLSLQRGTRMYAHNMNRHACIPRAAVTRILLIYTPFA